LLTLCTMREGKSKVPMYMLELKNPATGYGSRVRCIE
jgi:hypothetical protein